MTTSPEISVVIPTCGRADLLRVTLDTLLHQTYDLTRVEIIVVCDGHDADTASLVADVARRAPCSVHMVEQSRQGPAIARNSGIDAATGRVVVMLDDDIAAAPGLLAAHVSHHRDADDVVVTGALRMMATPDEPAHRRVVREWWDDEFRRMASRDHRPTFRNFVTGNVSVLRARLVDIGGFERTFTGYGREDYELGLRLEKAGLRFVHEPHAAGIHHYEKSPLEWLRMFRAIGRADVIFVRQHPERLDEVMALSPFARWPGVERAIPWLERFVLARNARGGRAWGIAANVTQGAHYWLGVESEAQDPEERARLVDARRRAREALLQAKRLRRGGTFWHRLRKWGQTRVSSLLGRPTRNDADQGVRFLDSNQGT